MSKAVKSNGVIQRAMLRIFRDLHRDNIDRAVQAINRDNLRCCNLATIKEIKEAYFAYFHTNPGKAETMREKMDLLNEYIRIRERQSSKLRAEKSEFPGDDPFAVLH